MTVVYSAILSSKNKRLDGLPVELRYPTKIEKGTKFKRLDPLCNNSTYDEKQWYTNEVLPCLVK